MTSILHQNWSELESDRKDKMEFSDKFEEVEAIRQTKEESSGKSHINSEQSKIKHKYLNIIMNNVKKNRIFK